MKNNISIEIEDYYGNTESAFMIDVEKENIIEHDAYNKLVLADIEDDYIFETDNPLFRFQPQKPLMDANEIQYFFEIAAKDLQNGVINNLNDYKIIDSEDLAIKLNCDPLYDTLVEALEKLKQKGQINGAHCFKCGLFMIY